MKSCILNILLGSFVFIFNIVIYSKTLNQNTIIFVSIAPYQYIVDAITGKNKFTVKPIIEQNQDPHVYEPSFKNIKDLASSYIFLSSNLNFEKILINKIQQIQNSKTQIFKITQNITCSTTPHDDSSHKLKTHYATHRVRQDNLHDNDNTHIWLSPNNIKKIANNIYKVLIKINPQEEKLYKQNLNIFINKIDELDKTIQNSLSKHKGKNFYTYHPFLECFASDYGLNQIALEHEGKEPSVQYLQKMLQHAQKDKPKIIFVQPQFNKKFAQIFSQSLGDIKLVEINPLEYNLYENLLKINESLSLNFEK